MNSEIKFPAPPPTVFKFFHPNRAGILKDLKIRFANPAHFNDPFEVCPRFDLWAEKVANEAIQQCIAANAQIGIPPEKSLEFLGDYMSRMLPERVKSHGKSFQEECGERFRMLCFCENIQSPLMWGHYCDSQQGFALEFYTNHDFFHKRLAKVHYDKARPKINDPKTSLWIPLIKNEEWIYEQEWRIVHEVNSGAPYFENLPPECLKAVYFGLRISPATRREILTATDSSIFANVQKYQMTLHLSEYKLIPIPFQNNPDAENWWLGEGI